MLVNILETLESSKTWLGAYASIYNLYTQYGFNLADSVANSFEYQAQIASEKKYPDDKYGELMERSVVERAKISIELNMSQGVLIRSRVEFCTKLLESIQLRIGDVSFPLHDYDMLVMLDRLIIGTPEHPLIKTYLPESKHLVIEDQSETTKLFMNIMEKHRELPNLPFQVGSLGSSVK